MACRPGGSRWARVSVAWCLATLFAAPLRRVDVETLPQALACTFGNPIRPLVAVSDSIGIFLTIPAQATSAIALLTVLLQWPAAPVFLLVSLLVIACVFMGGAISAGAAGFAKLLISFTALLVFGAVAIAIGGGFAAFQAQLPSRYFSLFGNGFWQDIGNGLGIAFGVLTTQVYVRAVLCGNRALAPSSPPAAPRYSGWAVLRSGCS
jgi:Na+/proline symporter